MTKTNERFLHGEHNEKACEYLVLNAEFRDWVITTAFYSALHFIASKIFPFDAASIEGKKTQIQNIDQYYNYSKAKSRNISKHELLLDLIDKRISDNNAYEYYDWLLSTATTARYGHYQYDQEIANRAVTYMRKIKAFCTPGTPATAKKA